MAFEKAERARLYLRCALFGPSGSGKTMTALRMAKGIAGKMGTPVAVIDTEARSASKYADRFAFDVDNLSQKTIDHYTALMNEAAKAGYKVLVIDSLSHAWRELTDEVDRLTQASASKNSVLSWGKVNHKQKRLVEAILNYPGHLIATMRSKTDWVIGEGKNGKTAPEKLGLAPEQGKGIEYEFDLLVEMSQSHQAVITKDRTGKFQDEVIDKPGEDFGVALYDWLTSGVAVKPETHPVQHGAAKPETATAPVQKNEAKPAKNAPAPNKGSASLKERSAAVIKEIGEIVTAVGNGGGYFTEDERGEARQLIQGAKATEGGLNDLIVLKEFLAEELAKRDKKAA
jgi:hypothetical protein